MWGRNVRPLVLSWHALYRLALWRLEPRVDEKNRDFGRYRATSGASIDEHRVSKFSGIG